MIGFVWICTIWINMVFHDFSYHQCTTWIFPFRNAVGELFRHVFSLPHGLALGSLGTGGEILATLRMVKSRIVLNLDDDFIASLTNCVARLKTAKTGSFCGSVAGFPGLEIRSDKSNIYLLYIIQIHYVFIYILYICKRNLNTDKCSIMKHMIQFD